ncbi:uncharacterized protein lcorl isoform X1 [Conger conger]|uniref:uncharacterized protein lcorl isoform X1 n=1 Tax=Conger conger TaxID=82655 RepID=UPI002A59B92F|nr:uncharacterized protein lcorl isoform X1 [Conger conger]
MATQCRSSKCTAERKGFRRELDSWRHKLVHCVGFESILEGIYGPRLLRDLSIFDDCEPDAVSDWSVDASCSFCNLQLEKLSDHIPTVSSPQSTPTEESPPQGQSNTENIECQADRFLHAIFRKKDLPQSCDPNIPLVAQELMKKMIHQFAVEYASKSQIEGAENLTSSSPPLPPDQDSPLDLTVNRNQPNVEQDGVLDLSKKNCASSALSTSSNQKASGSLEPAGDVPLDAREEKFEARSSTLETVLSTLCPYHKTLLYQILKSMREYYSASAHRHKNANGLFAQTDNPLCCHLSSKLHQDMCSFGDYKTSNGCYVQACRVNAFPVTPVCICLKSLHCLSCQTMAIGCINSVVGPSSCGCFPNHQRLSCSCQNYIDGAYITPVGNVASAPFSPQKVRDSCHSCAKGCSPSPPPLSPIPSDVRGKISDKTFVCSFVDGKTCSNQPPSLFPFEEEGDALFQKDCLDKGNDVSDEEPKSQKDNEEGTVCSTESSRCLKERQSGTIIQDLMERVNEKLKKIEPLEMQQNVSTTVNKSLECIDDVHLGKIITTVLHNGNDHDYTIKELPCQPEAIVENEPIQTRFSRSQMTTQHNLCLDFPSSSCQSVEGKNYLPELSQSLWSGKETLEESRNPNAGIKEDANSSDFQLTSDASDMEGASEDGITTDICDNQISKGVNTELPLCTSDNKGDSQKIEDSATEDCAISMKGLPLGSHGPEKQVFPPQSKDCSDLARSRRNIVPPQRFSSYVTEPRKMYFAACFSESIFIRRASKDKVLKGADSDNSSPEMERNKSSTEPVVREPSNAASNIEMLDEDEQDCDKPNKIKQVTTTSRTRSQSIAAGVKAVEDNRTIRRSPRTKQHEVSRSHARSKSSDTHRDDHDSCLQRDNPPESTHANESESVSSTVPQYTSPIRLMFVSPVVCENGIRYTLRSAVSGSTAEGETFDPCEESSWGGSINTSIKEMEPLASCVILDEKSLQKGEDATDASRPDPLNGKEVNGKETNPIVPEIPSSPLKRKPGRPKKLGPQIEKRAKRPIGRPPKHKDKNSKSDDKGNTENINNPAVSCEEKDERTNKNLKITVVYGRSRRIKRLVSEDDGNLIKDQQTEHQDDGRQKCDLNGNVLALSTNDNTSEKLPEGQAKNLNFVGPMKDRKCVPSSELKCQKQNRSVAMRKPGRPPKVKISGISVTVTTVSPKQRKIRINNEVTESGGERPQQEKAIILDDKPSKEQTTISSDATPEETTQNVEDKRMSKKTPAVALRHSARERRPSIHFLHSVATSRMFSHSNALLRRSKKLLLNKASSEPNQTKSLEKSTEPPVIPERASRPRRGQNLSFLSGISADSIFTSNEAIKWWPTSASYETLNEELSRRIQLMSDTWIADAVESSKSCPSKMETDLGERTCSAVNDLPKNSVSAVKMLFQKHCNMEDLCAWFMQTTETQSLAIVRKSSARNPYEIIQFNPYRISKRSNVCPSPQAERLRKHVKKFAKIVPKSPVMHLLAQERISSSGRLHVKRQLFPRRSSAIAGMVHKCNLWSRGKPFSKYQSTLLRLKSKFKTRKRLSKGMKRESDRVDGASSGVSGTNADTPAKDSQLQVRHSSLSVDTLNSYVIGERESTVQGQNSKGATCVEREARVCSKEWSPGTMRECRVFLKKINSPETKSTVEDCNLCTVQLCDISSEYSLPASTCHREDQTEPEKPENVSSERIRRTTRKMSSQYPKELWVQTMERRGKRKSNDTSEAQPAKKDKTI